MKRRTAHPRPAAAASVHFQLTIQVRIHFSLKLTYLLLHIGGWLLL
ncbi:hypothetical protein LMG26846_02070 [Achromobacter insuavis]|nr:hypothetical protein LMG26846_02070 [Achromobacter insuavis]